MIKSEEMQNILDNIKKGGPLDNIGANMFESNVRKEMSTKKTDDKTSSKTAVEEA